ncbi:hypothetical protein MSAN_00046600 [Mycena sanguinolenta]|uniref:PI-PLC Y-box domain-containing protein n=1 Tax=Mycena sanguinolenta TaxID=230812 RepID=A0A8H6ZF77_9AGAR|nr:hypothetical protein MSAN_00046600 [Mycena sanguinolenta]
MHSSIHSLAHRAPPATRSRVRWQPYNAAVASASTSLPSRSPSISYLSTPATSVTSSPPPKSVQLCELKAQSSMPQTPRDPLNSLRENPKNKYATGLVDQAVKSLCEIWRPQDIPNVFLTSSRATVGSCSELPPAAPPQSRRRNTQLPSPVSPLTQPSPPSPTPATAALECARTAAAVCDQDAFNRSNLVPIKGFVHEVLRRSRTSGSVLQTALCYLEAIRPKVPELIRKAQSNEASCEYDSESRVTPATAEELELEAQLSSVDLSTTFRAEEDVMDTVRVYDNEDLASTATPYVGGGSPTQTQTTPQAKIVGNPTAPAPLPSPLLCPRRAFLASLILASKFTQDKCYSNRAWAKLSGLPAREIGRCERALGDALDWRLWVGKTPVASHSGAPSPTTTSIAAAPVASSSRSVVRCRSEVILPASKGPFLALNDNRETATNGNAKASSSAKASPVRGLRRCSTLPADAFAEKRSRVASKPYPAGGNTSGTSYLPEATWNGEGHQLSFSNIATQDELMGSPEFDAIVSPPSPTSTSSTYDSYASLSPIPSPPSLSYSPSSTESSSGDRTIQMSTFMDDAMERGPLAHDAVVVCGNEWSAASPTTLSGSAFEAAAAAFGPEHAAVIYGLRSSSYAPDSSLLGVSSLLGMGQAQAPSGPNAANASAWLWSDAHRVSSDDYPPAHFDKMLGSAAIATEQPLPNAPARPAAFFGDSAVGLSAIGGQWCALESTFTALPGSVLHATNYAAS